MLGLAAPTSQGWVERALGSLDEILIDHAHCEKKAAGSAIKLLFRYPRRDFLQVPLARLAREELAHFERLLEELRTRGLGLRPLRPAPYGARLQALVRTPEPQQLLDRLLVSALIEARSCERFQLLAEALGDVPPAALYRGLLSSEARHHQVYVRLARALAPAVEVRERLGQLARAEAAILREPAAHARLHT